MYFNNPVHIALEKAQGQGYTHSSEDTRAQTTRADKVYYRGGRSYAVLDYKKPGYLNRDEFLQSIARNATEYEENISKAHEGEYIWDEAVWLLKQAIHYSEKFETPFVALFDWNTLVLLVFVQRELNNGGDYCYMTVVQQSSQFRKAFLGFLLAADEYHNGGSSASVLDEIRPTIGYDFAAIVRDNIEPKVHNTRGKHFNYESQYQSESPSGSQTTQVGSYQNQEYPYGPSSTVRGRGHSRKQYYPPKSGRERTGADDRYVRGRSTEPSKERARSKTRDGRGYRIEEPRSRSQYSADRVKIGRTQPTYGGIIASAGSQAMYYQQGNPASGGSQVPYYQQGNPTSATTYKYASGRDNNYQLDGKVVLPERGRTDKSKDRQKGGKLRWFSR